MTTRGRLDTGSVIVGDRLVLSPPACALLAPTLRNAIRCTVNPSPTAVQVVSQVELLGRTAGFRGRAETTSAADQPRLSRDLDTTAAARLLECSTRNVRYLAEFGRIPAHWDGHWKFSLEAILTYAAQRRR